VQVEAARRPTGGQTRRIPHAGERHAHAEIAKLGDAEDRDGVLNRAYRAAAGVESGIDKAEHGTGEDRVFLDYGGHFRKAYVVIGERRHELVEDRGKGRELGDGLQRFFAVGGGGGDGGGGGAHLLRLIGWIGGGKRKFGRDLTGRIKPENGREGC
jgi:hypothetical protein